MLRMNLSSNPDAEKKTVLTKARIIQLTFFNSPIRWLLRYSLNNHKFMISSHNPYHLFNTLGILLHFCEFIILSLNP